MTKLFSHEVGEARYSAGVDRGVFYPPLGPGVPWNGLISVVEDIDSSDISVVYMDGIKMQTQTKLGAFKASITALSYPPEFEEFDGYAEDNWTNQVRKPFNLSYRTMLGDDVSGLNRGYLIHLVYHAMAEPSDKSYGSLDTITDPTPFNWTLSTTPVPVKDLRPSSHLVIDASTAYPSLINALEDILYGSNVSDPRFPTIEEVSNLFDQHAIFKVTDLGGGVARIEGPDEAVYLTSPTSAQLTWVSVVPIDGETYKLTSF